MRLDSRPPDRRKIWWVQGEALLGMLELYRLAGEASGTPRLATGGPMARQPAPGKGPYHSGRALIEGFETVDRLIAYDGVAGLDPHLLHPLH